MLWLLLLILGVGLIIGAIARLLVPGPNKIGLIRTWLLGILGSFAGGLLGYLVFGADADDGLVQTAGFLGSIVGAVLLLLLYERFMNGRRHI